jgi:hypothetical protein
MAIPVQNGLSSLTIFTSDTADGLRIVETGQFSTGQQVNRVLEAPPTIPVMDVLGEIVEPGLFASGASGTPTAGVPPTPAPTVYEAVATASTGKQPEVTSPYASDPAWEVDSTHPTVSVSGVTPGQNT